MKILIDDSHKSWDYEDALTLSDVILDINQRLIVEDKKIVVEFKVDEIDDRLDMNLTPDQVTLEYIKQVSFKTKSVKSFLQDEIDKAEKSAIEMKELLKQVIDHLIAEEKDIGMNTLVTLVGKLMWVFGLFERLRKMGAVNFDAVKINNSTFGEFIEHFNRILKELIEAMENGDDILVNDFLEYELDPAMSDLSRLIPALGEYIQNLEFD